MQMEEVMDLVLQDFRIPLDDPRLQLGARWKDIVGEKAASHTKPYDVEGDTLVVKADHPVWIQLLSLQRSQVVKRVCQAFPSLGIAHLKVIHAS